MDLLRIILNTVNPKDVCCLCYTETQDTISLALDDVVEIHNDNFNFHSTIRGIIKSLFPLHDLALTHICEHCSSLMIKIFIIMQKNTLKNGILQDIADRLDSQIEEMEYKLRLKRKLQKCQLKLDLLASKKNIKNNSIQCVKCHMKFKSKFLIKTHFEMAHKYKNNANVCDTCGKVFLKNSTLEAHLSCHKQKQCPHCFKTLKSHSHYNIHLKNHTEKVREKRKSKYYECNHCDYKSLNKMSLNAHTNKSHLGIKPFTCDLCQKGFYKKDNLVQHLATHNRIKDKTCYICGDSFGCEKSLVAHLKLHSGEKPYKCEICNVGFITSGRRHEHMKRKHMEKNEVCIVCGKVFSLKKDLNKHMKNVHSL